MIPELTALAQTLGVSAVLIPLALGVLVTGMVFLAQSVAAWFDDRNP
jgi:hypothetical protein